MNEDTSTFIEYIWQHKPIIIVLLIGVAILLPLLFIDTHRHRKKEKRRHPKKH